MSHQHETCIDKDDNPPAGKKRKLSDDSEEELEPLNATPQPESPVTKRGDIWIDDGNIIIQAEQTQFCVHKSRLSTCSSIFRDIFSLPQPVEGGDLEQGCPVVHLHDSAEDVTELLSILYDYKDSDGPAEYGRLKTQQLSTRLRLANKYDITHLRRSALLRIRSEFAIAFERATFTKFRHLTIGNASDHIALANLFHREGVFSAMPTALFNVVAFLTTEEILYGVRHDGTTTILSLDLIGPCILGKERMVNFMCHVSFKWLEEKRKYFANCPQKACHWFVPRLEKQLLKVPIQVAHMFAQWALIKGCPSPEASLCFSCELMSAKYHEDGRKAAFEALPSFFGYESWAKLEAMDLHPI